MSDFKAQLEKIQTEFIQEEHRTENEFNIFNALYNNREEKLHSRFISYLLSPTSRHGMGYKFLKSFIEVLSEHGHGEKLNKFDLSNCEVIPDEKNKVEYKKIDILIKNAYKQAIVIENKIYARDSNHENKPQEQQIQLNRYCKVLEEDGITDIITIYLTLDRHNPEREDEIKYHPIKIDYHREIPKWLDKCIEIADNCFLLKNILLQYKSVILTLTNNLDRVEELKGLIDENINEDLDNTWEERNYIYSMDDFKHVKWHTIEEFWRELADSIGGDPFNAKIKHRITIEEISGIVHKNWKGSYGITFELGNGEEWYIVNDKINGLTYGNCGIEINDKEEDKNWFIAFKDENKRINLTDFNNKETFMLINAKNRKDTIEKIIDSVAKKSK